MVTKMGMITDGEYRVDLRNKQKSGVKYLTWYRVAIDSKYINIPAPLDSKDSIYQWLLDTCIGNYVFGNHLMVKSGHTILFECEEDVIMCKLRWG